jgi:hypothetical protein
MPVKNQASDEKKEPFDRKRSGVRFFLYRIFGLLCGQVPSTDGKTIGRK